MAFNPYEKIRYEIERRFKMYANDQPEKKQFWLGAASEVNDVFDPHSSKLEQCAMCGAAKAFEIDEENPSDGYCHAEGTVWSLRPGRNAQKFSKRNGN